MGFIFHLNLISLSDSKMNEIKVSIYTKVANEILVYRNTKKSLMNMVLFRTAFFVCLGYLVQTIFSKPFC